MLWYHREESLNIIFLKRRNMISGQEKIIIVFRIMMHIQIWRDSYPVLMVRTLTHSTKHSDYIYVVFG
jgi:hypothetical protein